MFKNSDYYDLNAAQQTIADKRLMLDIYIKNLAIVELLKKHNITNDLEIEACENYIKTLPEIKTVLDIMKQSESKIHEYQSNPEQHLRDLFQAKINRTIK